jgi:hypothetical protein
MVFSGRHASRSRSGRDSVGVGQGRRYEAVLLFYHRAGGQAPPSPASLSQERKFIRSAVQLNLLEPAPEKCTERAVTPQHTSCASAPAYGRSSTLGHCGVRNSKCRDRFNNPAISSKRRTGSNFQQTPRGPLFLHLGKRIRGNRQ